MNFNLNASYKIINTWQTGYQVEVTIKNNTSQPSTSWSSQFILSANQTISSSWNCVMKVSGSSYTASNPTWNGGGVIAANNSTTYGFIVNNPYGLPNQLYNLIATANGSTTITPPIAPILNSITLINTNSYNVTWNAVSNATSYTLQQSSDNTFTTPTTFSLTTTSKSFTNQSNGNYYYRVSASNSAGTSSYSNVQSITVNIISLNAPVLSTISNSGNYNYIIQWNSVANAQGYTLTQSADSSFTSPIILYQGANITYTVSNQPLGTYYYKVTAYSGSITSPSSNVQSVTVTQTIPVNKTFVEGYWESWKADSISLIVNMNVNIIDISFVTFQSTGNNTFQVIGLDTSQSDLTNFITAAHNAGKKVKISVGGATYPQSSFLTSTAAAQGMANAIAAFVQINNLDGIDYDIEDYPAASLQIALLQYTRNALPNAIISYTAKTPASTTTPYKQVITGGFNYFSYTSLMAYDAYSGYSYASDISSLISLGVPANKICLGLMPGLDDTNVLTSLSDVQAGANYVLTNKLAGLMMWDLNRDLDNATGLGSNVAFKAAYTILG